jgi:hypothetical protein
MSDNPSPHHIQINVHKAANQVLIRRNGRGKVAALPKCALSRFPLIVLLGHPTSDQPHASWDFSMAQVFYQQVNMIAGCDVVQDGQAIAFTRLKQPVLPAQPIAFKLQEELPIMTSVSDVPDGARQVIAIGSRHDDGLRLDPTNLAQNAVINYGKTP